MTTDLSINKSSNELSPVSKVSSQGSIFKKQKDVTRIFLCLVCGLQLFQPLNYKVQDYIAIFLLSTFLLLVNTNPSQREERSHLCCEQRSGTQNSLEDPNSMCTSHLYPGLNSPGLYSQGTGSIEKRSKPRIKLANKTHALGKNKQVHRLRPLPL